MGTASCKVQWNDSIRWNWVSLSSHLKQLEQSQKGYSCSVVLCVKCSTNYMVKGSEDSYLVMSRDDHGDIKVQPYGLSLEFVVFFFDFFFSDVRIQLNLRPKQIKIGQTITISTCITFKFKSWC